MARSISSLTLNALDELKINGGFYGEQPSLSKLKDGDMIYTTDYRSIYNTVLGSWFSISQNKFSSFNIPGLQKILV